MTDMTDSEQLAGLIATVGALRDEVQGLRQDFRDQRETFVPSREFIAWKTGMDREIASMKASHTTEMAEMRAAHQREVDARRASRAPWWSVAAVIVAGLTLALTVVLNLNAPH